MPGQPVSKAPIHGSYITLQGTSEPVLHIRHHCAALRTLRKVDHAAAIFADHGLFGVAIEILANDQDHLSAVTALRVWKRGNGR